MNESPKTRAPFEDSSTGTATFNLQVGKIFEDLQLWQQAEEHYLLAGQSGASSPPLLQNALDGVKRARGGKIKAESLSQFLDNCTKIVDTIGAWMLRFLVAVVATALIATAVLHFRDSRNTVEIAPFSVLADKKLGNQIASSFLKLRSKLIAAATPGTDPSLEILIPFDPGPLSEVSFEAGGFKLASVWQVLFRPRFRVTGIGHTDTNSLTLSAQIWRRRWWFGSELQQSVFAEIPISGQVDVVELETFIYAVFLKILYAPR